MADKHPYTSGAGGLVAAVAQLRKIFPSKVTADTFKKLGIAPNNETYIINILRFLEIVDAEGNKNAKAASVLVQHDEAEFQKGFAELVESAYKALFELLGADAWVAPIDKLISFFRNSDHTSDIVGRRQATTFQTLATISGKLDGQLPKTISAKPKRADGPAKKKPTKAGSQKPPFIVDSSAAHHSPGTVTGAGPGLGSAGNSRSGDMALTVRIEINLPAGGDKETYDNIFKSIRENLLNGKSP